MALLHNHYRHQNATVYMLCTADLHMSMSARYNTEGTAMKAQQCLAFVLLSHMSAIQNLVLPWKHKNRLICNSVKIKICFTDINNINVLMSSHKVPGFLV